MTEIELLAERPRPGLRPAAPWHGTNLKGSLRGLKAAEAAWRPAEGRHNVWELVAHAAYWKYIACHRILGVRGTSFALPGSNFFVRPEGEPTEKAWKTDVALLDECHIKLRATVAELDPARLAETGKKWTVRETILGAAMHDTYHAGQIQLLRRLREGYRRSRALAVLVDPAGRRRRAFGLERHVRPSSAQDVDRFADAVEGQLVHREDFPYLVDRRLVPDVFWLGVEPGGIGAFLAETLQPADDPVSRLLCIRSIAPPTWVSS